MTGFRSILVVDDEAMLRSLVARAFRERGYEVVEAGDGVAALEAIQSAFRPFDLVITDSRMPGLDGPTWLSASVKHTPSSRSSTFRGARVRAVARRHAIKRSHFPEAV